MSKMNWGHSFNNWTPSDKQARLDEVPTAGTGEVISRTSNWIVDDEEAALALARQRATKQSGK